MALSRYFVMKWVADFAHSSTDHCNVHNGVNHTGVLADGSIILDLMSESFAPENSLLEARGFTRRGIAKVGAGKFLTKGGFEGYACTENLMWLLYGVCGYDAIDTTDYGDSVTDRRFYAPADHIPFFDASIGTDQFNLATGGNHEKNIWNGVIGSLTITANAGDLLTISADVPGAEKIELATDANSLAKDTTDLTLNEVRGGDLLVYHTGVVEIRDAQSTGAFNAIDVESITITINANPQIDTAKLGLRTPYFKRLLDNSEYYQTDSGFGDTAHYCPCGDRSIEIELVVDNSVTIFDNYFMQGGYAGGGTSPTTGVLTGLELMVSFEGQNSSGTGDANLKIAIFDFPRCYVKTPPAPMNQRERITKTITLVVAMDESEGAIVNLDEAVDDSTSAAVVASAFLNTNVVPAWDTAPVYYGSMIAMIIDSDVTDGHRTSEYDYDWYGLVT